MKAAIPSMTQVSLVNSINTIKGGTHVAHAGELMSAGGWICVHVCVAIYIYMLYVIHVHKYNIYIYTLYIILYNII